MKKSIFAIIGAAIVIGGSAYATVGTASAATQADCQDGNVCLFEKMGYEGDLFQTTNPTVFDLRDGTNMNDRTTSIWNRTKSYICFYADPDGPHGTNHMLVKLDPGGSNPYIGKDASDRISAITECSYFTPNP